MRRRSLKSRVARALGWGAIAWLVASTGTVAALRWIDPPFSMLMLLEPGALDAIAFRWAPHERIPVVAARAAIAAEDQRFLEHFGFDFVQLGEAIREYRDGDPLRGASTISQQVAKNLFLWNQRNLARKVLEAYFTVLIEAFWSKQRTLEIYLNIAEFGAGTFGVDQAAVRLLGIRLEQVRQSDAALLAAVLPSPKRLRADSPSAYLLMRRTQIEAQMRLLERRGHYRALDW